MIKFISKIKSWFKKTKFIDIHKVFEYSDESSHLIVHLKPVCKEAFFIIKEYTNNDNGTYMKIPSNNIAHIYNPENAKSMAGIILNVDSIKVVKK